MLALQCVVRCIGKIKLLRIKRVHTALCKVDAWKVTRLICQSTSVSVQMPRSLTTAFFPAALNPVAEFTDPGSHRIPFLVTAALFTGCFLPSIVCPGLARQFEAGCRVGLHTRCWLTEETDSHVLAFMSTEAVSAQIGRRDASRCVYVGGGFSTACSGQFEWFSTILRECWSLRLYIFDIIRMEEQ